MQLMGKRSLAWVLKWINDAAILFFLLILLWILPFAVGGVLSRSSYVVHDLPMSYPQLSIEGIEPISADKEVIQVEARTAAITFRTERDLPTVVLVMSGVNVSFGLIIWILWLLRRILVSLVAREPLTEANARRFRSIGLLIVSLGIFMGLHGILAYFYLHSHFQLPSLGYVRLISNHFPLTILFLGLLVLLMAEVMRIGAEHRVDSEAVI